MRYLSYSCINFVCINPAIRSGWCENLNGWMTPRNRSNFFQFWSFRLFDRREIQGPNSTTTDILLFLSCEHHTHTFPAFHPTHVLSTQIIIINTSFVWDTNFTVIKILPIWKRNEIRNRAPFILKYSTNKILYLPMLTICSVYVSALKMIRFELEYVLYNFLMILYTNFLFIMFSYKIHTEKRRNEGKMTSV